MSQPAILVIGDWQRSEMSLVRDWIKSLGSRASVRQINQLSDAMCEPPDMVIVCQSWPDEFSAPEVSAVLGRWPLTQWICCYGAWCDSDGRTRSIWPGSVRVRVDEVVSRLNRVWQIVSESRAEPLPLTASRDETFAFDHSPSSDKQAEPADTLSRSKPVV